jgi:hypothetical protein
MKVKYPTHATMYYACRSVKNWITDDCRCDDETDRPSIRLTIGFSPKTGEWDSQTGDNSYSGPAYFHPHWAVVDIFRNSNCKELANDILSQLHDLVNS